MNPTKSNSPEPKEIPVLENYINEIGFEIAD
jgi:hypothetical protein